GRGASRLSISPKIRSQFPPTRAERVPTRRPADPHDRRTVPMSTLPLRPARTTDPAEVDRLYEICLRTGASGADATALYADPRLLGEVYLGAYLALEPGLAFVVEADGVAAGYVLGARDTAAFEARTEREWWPALRERYPLGTFPADSRDEALVQQIHRPHRTHAAILGPSPSHLPVDLLPAAPGGGHG